jgi:hypothetical protein
MTPTDVVGNRRLSGVRERRFGVVEALVAATSSCRWVVGVLG